MIIILQLCLIILLYIISRLVICKLIGKSARRVIFEKIELNNSLALDRRIIKFILFFLVVVLLYLFSGYSFIFSFFMGGLSVIGINCIFVIKKRVRKKKVLQDLLNISECLRVQISSQIPLANALRTLPELCENKEFAALLTNIYLEYELAKFIILDSGDTLINKFDYPEVRIFISALNQQIQGTSAIEAFDNLINILKEKYIEFLEDSTKNKVAIMTMGVFIIVLNVAALGIYPVAVEAFNAMNLMLK